MTPEGTFADCIKFVMYKMLTMRLTASIVLDNVGTIRHLNPKGDMS